MEQKEITWEVCEKAWQAFDKYKETAEQHEFVTIMLWDAKIVPLYEDLKKNWDSKHGQIFMKGMRLVGEQFGFSVEE